MDEPFGAIDPITRSRLQGEFLRLQAEVRKTVVFVTHDVEEAVRMGDRIAILSEGGHLQQYDTPAHILGHPATPFVADFVGADRGLKRLSVTPLSAAQLEHADGVADGAGLAEAEQVLTAAGRPVGGAVPLSALLQTDTGRVAVVDGDRFIGVLTPDAVHRSLRADVDRGDEG